MDDYPQELLDSYVTRTSRSRRSLGDSTSSVQSRQSLRTVPVSRQTRIPHPTAPSSAPIPTDSSLSSIRELASSTRYAPSLAESLSQAPAPEETNTVLNIVNLWSWWGDMFRALDYVIQIRDNMNRMTRTPEDYAKAMQDIKDGTSSQGMSDALDILISYTPALKPEIQEIITRFFMKLLQQDDNWSHLKHGLNWDAKETLRRWSIACLREIFDLFINYINRQEAASSEELTQSGSLRLTYATRPPLPY